MPPVEQASKGKQYWRSLNELSGSPEFKEFLAREFPAGASEMFSETSRRNFLRLMGASLALAGVGVTGCVLPKEKVEPFGTNPPDFTPGVPKQFATAIEFGGFGTGLLASSYDGRPIKLEGNPAHPASKGSTSALTQAMVLGLYDPDRSQRPVRRDTGKATASDLNEFMAALVPVCEQHRSSQGQGIAVLSEPSASPSLSLVKQWFSAAFPQGRWYEYEAVSYDAETDGARLVFGAPLRMVPDFSQSRVTLSLGSDFLMLHPQAVANARSFAASRNPDNGWMSRLYVAESALTVTGGQADHRIILGHQQIGAFAGALAHELLGKRGLALPANMPDFLGGLLQFANSGADAELLGQVANDLMANQGRCVVIAGRGQAPEVHALAYILNVALGNDGRTVSFVPDSIGSSNQTQGITELAGELKGGAVSTLLVLGGNPAYNAPADLDFGPAIAKASYSAHLSLYDDETSKLCKWHVPQAHFLESWGDVRSADGTVSGVQPLIDPLYGGLTSAELAALACRGEQVKGYDIAREAAQKWIGGAQFEDLWKQALKDGVVPGAAQPPVAPLLTGAPSAEALGKLASAGSGGLGLVFNPDYTQFDGRFANNAWLQELPDPVTKVTWDNPLLISYQKAKELGLQDEDMVRLEAGGLSLELPVVMVPGQEANTLVATLGYGRDGLGRVANKVGFNTYALRTVSGMNFVADAKITKLGRRYKLAMTQDHYALDARGFNERQARVGRLFRETNFDEFKAEPDFAKHYFHGEDVQLWVKPVEYNGHKWGMTIDLNSCTGCGACIAACQAENNIPVVGKSYVRRNREMHWIRVDRYFTGDPENPQVASMPVTCHHCENAPCEQVCPVGATVHSHEGLNEMVYNRCIGTRYCSNNCPYKVRRFNYLNFRKHMTPIEKMGMNPEVTVRSRGVMEKCSYCVQRIQQVKIAAKREDRPIADLEIVTACMGACPSQAISFGDLNDQHSQVRLLQEAPRSYHILEDLMTAPRTLYLAKVRNPAGGGPVKTTSESAHAGEGGH